MSDGRDKHISKQDTTHKSGIQYTDVVHHPKKHSDQQLYLAQQVTGHPVWGQVAPNAKKEVTKQSVNRGNEDHGTNGQDMPTAGNSPEEQRRAKAAAAAKARADQNRGPNQKELEPNSLGILSATVHGWEAPLATEAGRRGLNYYQLRYNNPQIKELQQHFHALDAQIAKDTKDLARATKGTDEYARLEERVQAYKRLQLGKNKTANGQTIANAEMAKLESGQLKGFSTDEVAHLSALQDKEKLLLAEKGEAMTALKGERLAGAGRVIKGVAGAGATYWFDNTVSSNLKRGGNDAWAEFMAPSTLEIMAVGGTMTAPVPKFVPGAGGPWYAKLGARAIWEIGVDLTSKVVAFGYNKMTDPDVEKRHLDTAKQSQTDDHKQPTPNAMNNAVDAWKVLGNHDNQIQQAIDEAGSQIGTTDPAKLAQTRRDLAALYTAFGESRLEKGTKVGGQDVNGNGMNGPKNQHYLFEGTDYDFGGVAMRNLNTARNALNELGIPSTDLVAMRVYGSYHNSDMTRIMNPHNDLPKIYDQLKTMVHKNDPDAQWLSSWLTTRVADQKQLLTSEERAAKEHGTKFVPQWNQHVMAKVYQDQALLDMAYAANGQDAQTHLKAAHDELQLAQHYGWDGHKISVGGQELRRQSDLPKLVEIYRSLGGTVDW
jgi:hypothetical protein